MSVVNKREPRKRRNGKEKEDSKLVPMKSKEEYRLNEGGKKPFQPKMILKRNDGDVSSSPTSKPVSPTLEKTLAAPVKPAAVFASTPQMNRPIPLIENFQFTGDSVLEHLTSNNQFLVIGCLGLQGVGKSTILNQLCGLEKDVFKTEDFQNVITCTHATLSLELFVTKERVFFLDTPPILSPSTLDSAGKPSTGGGCLLGGFSDAENSLEATSMQLAAFVFSVCHVVLFVQTVEMLKSPTITRTLSGALTEYYPHMVFVQNKAHSSEFSVNNVKSMQEVYVKSFTNSRLQIQSGIGIGMGTLVDHLNPATCSDPVNLYVVADTVAERNTAVMGRPAAVETFDHMRRELYGIPRQPLSHVALSEKSWFAYCGKVWEAITCSSLFHEYDRVMTLNKAE